MDESSSIVMVLVKIRKKSQVVVDLFGILIVDELKILLEILKFVMSYMLKYEAYIRG
jgi:hypothetical protein